MKFSTFIWIWSRFYDIFKISSIFRTYWKSCQTDAIFGFSIQGSSENHFKNVLTIQPFLPKIAKNHTSLKSEKNVEVRNKRNQPFTKNEWTGLKFFTLLTKRLLHFCGYKKFISQQYFCCTLIFYHIFGMLKFLKILIPQQY